MNQIADEAIAEIEAIGQVHRAAERAEHSRTARALRDRFDDTMRRRRGD